VTGPTNTEASRKRNVKLALILASVALTFFVGIVVKITLLSH
jgi:hypothetical protein